LPEETAALRNAVLLLLSFFAIVDVRHRARNGGASVIGSAFDVGRGIILSRSNSWSGNPFSPLATGFVTFLSLGFSQNSTAVERWQD
jgi:hypothetical protein